MNYRRGIFRIWTVATACWIIFVLGASLRDTRDLWDVEWTVLGFLMLAIVPPIAIAVAGIIGFQVLSRTGSWIIRGFTDRN